MDDAFNRIVLLVLFDVFAEEGESEEARVWLQRLRNPSAVLVEEAVANAVVQQRLHDMWNVRLAWEGAAESQGAAALTHIAEEREGAVVLQREVADWIRQLERGLDERGLFDYGAIAGTMVEQAADVCRRLCPPLEALGTISASPSLPFLEDWSRQIDIAFQASGTTMVYPDANTFTPALQETWAELAPKPGRLYPDFVMRSFKAPCHECIHCCQSHVKQVDPDPMSWSAEHDASYLQGSLLFAILTHWRTQEADGDVFPASVGPYPPLLYEAIHCQWVQHFAVLFDKFRHLEEDYCRWRDSFGMEGPAADLPPGGAYYFKDRLSLEALTKDPAVLQHQVHACFLDRTGDVTQYRDRSIPEPCRIRPDQTLPHLLLTLEEQQQQHS